MRISGGWRVHDSITDEEIKVLKTALKGLVGVEYIPKMLATQIVNGINYCFVCKLTSATLNGREGISKIMIYKPLNGEPVITSIGSII